jgi:hypothetical protein
MSTGLSENGEAWTMVTAAIRFGLVSALTAQWLGQLCHARRRHELTKSSRHLSA